MGRVVRPGEEKKTSQLAIKIGPTLRKDLNTYFPYGEEVANKVRKFLAEQIEIRKGSTNNNNN